MLQQSFWPLYPERASHRCREHVFIQRTPNILCIILCALLLLIWNQLAATVEKMLSNQSGVVLTLAPVAVVDPCLARRG